MKYQCQICEKYKKIAVVKPNSRFNQRCVLIFLKQDSKTAAQISYFVLRGADDSSS